MFRIEGTYGGDLCPPASTVGRGKAALHAKPLRRKHWCDGMTTVSFGISLVNYDQWNTPGCILSEGTYGVLGFEGTPAAILKCPNGMSRM